MKKLGLFWVLFLSWVAHADTNVYGPGSAYVDITFSAGVQAEDEDYVELYCEGVYVCSGNNACWAYFTFYNTGDVFFEGYNFSSFQYASTIVTIESAPWTADLRASVTSGRAPLFVSFDGTHSIPPAPPASSNHVQVYWGYGPAGAVSNQWIWNATAGITSSWWYGNGGSSPLYYQATLGLTGTFGPTSYAAVHITVYPDSFRSVTVQGGTSNAAPFVAQGTTVNVTANTPPSNWSFIEWRTVNPTTGYFGNINASNTTFTVGSSDDTIYPYCEPAPPTNLNSPHQTHATVSLSWAASPVTQSLEGHDIYRTSGGVTTLIGTTSPSQLSFIDSNVVSGVAYSYQVRIRAGGVPSPLSNFTYVTVPAVPGPDDILTGLLAWWKHDEGVGSTTANAWGSSNTGVLANSPTWVAGQIGPYALQFNSASSQYVDADKIGPLAGSPKATLSAWVYATAGTIAVGNYLSPYRFSFIWHLGNGRVYLSAENGSSSYPSFSTGGATGWHHLVLVYDGTLSGANRITAYWDGVPKALTAGGADPASSLAASAQQPRFRAGFDSDNGYSNGRADDIRVYNRALSAANVAALYAFSGSSGGSPPTFVTQPQPATVPAGASASFTVAASGLPNPSYQWQRSAGGSGAWTNLSADSNYSQVTSSTLVVSGTSMAMTADAFRCVASNTSGSTTSNSASLTVTSSSPPLPPTAFPVIAMSANSFLVQWSDSPAAGYRLDVATNAGFTTFASGYQNLDVGTATQKWVMNMTPGTSYYFRVRAYNAFGTSGNSNSIEGPRFIATQSYATPGTYSYTLPASTNRISVEASGGGGYASSITVHNNEGPLYDYTANGGKGGHVRAMYAITSGQVNILVGSGGGDASAVWRVGGFQIVAGGGGSAGGHLDNDEEDEALGGAGGDAGASGSETVLPAGAGGGSGASTSQAGQGSPNGGGPLNLSSGAPYVHNGGGNGGAGYYGGGGGSGIWLGHYGSAVTAGGGGGSSYYDPGNGFIEDSAAIDNQAGGAGGTASSAAEGGNAKVHSYYLPFSVPRIITQPVALTFGTVNSDVTFSITATGLPAPQYQWRKNGTNITGATSSSLALSTIQVSDGGTYTAVVSNSMGSVTSNGAILTFPPSFALQPESQMVNATGANVTFTSTTAGYPTPAFQWKKNGTNLGGATNSSLSLTNVQASDFASYSVVATNSAGTATSVTVTLSLDTPPTAPPWINYAEKTATTASILWGAAADNVVVSHYLVFRGATQVGVTSELTFLDTGLTPSTAYAYTIKAVDNVGKVSNASSTLNLTTNASSSLDTDNDGLPNLVEAALGTNANAAASADASNQTQSVIHRPPQTGAP